MPQVVEAQSPTSEINLQTDCISTKKEQVQRWYLDPWSLDKNQIFVKLESPSRRPRPAGARAFARRHHGGEKGRFSPRRKRGLLDAPPRRGEGGRRDRRRGRFLRRAGGQAGGGRGDGRGRSLRRRRGGLLREKARRAGGSALASGDSEDAKHGAPKTDSCRLTSGRNPHRVHGRRRGMGEASPRTIMSPRR